MGTGLPEIVKEHVPPRASPHRVWSERDTETGKDKSDKKEIEVFRQKRQQQRLSCLIYNLIKFIKMLSVYRYAI